MSARKLWKISYNGFGNYDRPESKAKVYDIYVPNARAIYLSTKSEQSRTVTVWVDERDGQGWQRYEDIDLADGVES